MLEALVLVVLFGILNVGLKEYGRRGVIATLRATSGYGSDRFHRRGEDYWSFEERMHPEVDDFLWDCLWGFVLIFWTVPYLIRDHRIIRGLLRDHENGLVENQYLVSIL